MKIYRILLLAAILGSCSKDTHQEVLYRPLGCDSIAFSYRNDIEPIISANCSFAACHAPGGEGSYDYTRYEVLADRIRSGRLIQRIDLPADDPQHMPEGFRLDNCSLYKLKVWILQGFPNN